MPKAASSSVKVEHIFRALSDRTRLRILNLLQHGELCVCDLVGILDVPQPAASRHLAYLRRVGLVVSRKEGLWVFYKLALEQDDFHAHLRQCLSSCADFIPQLARDTADLEKTGRSDCCG